MTPVLILLTNGVVDRVSICSDSADLKERFMRLCEEHDVHPTDEQVADGYAEAGNITICASWADGPA